MQKGFSPRIWGPFLFALAALAGCSVEPAGNPSTASNPALYGPPSGTPAKVIPRARPMNANSQDWTRAPFSCVQTELSPATLYHSSTKHLGFFTHLADYGLGAPSFAAFNTPTGPKIVKNGEPMDVRWMEENWVLVWFAGAKGWTNWDSPWVVYLQHKPTAIKLDPGGLHFEFKQAAGDVVLFPLYGDEQAPLLKKDLSATHNLPGDKIRTWEWVRAIPREPLSRVKYWACATREFPMYCEDSFSVDRAKDTVTIRQRFQWHSIEDDWDTRHIKLAPVSPPLALASRDKRFPVVFSKPIMDFALPTAYGPYMAAEKVNGFDATFKVLQYINETEAFDTPQTTNHPTVQAALDRLRQAAREDFSQPGKYERHHRGSSNFCWAVMEDLWDAKGLPYYDDATRSHALASLRKYFREDVLATNRFQLREHPKGSGRTYYILERSGIGSNSGAGFQPANPGLGDAARFNASLLETLWAYAHFTGDWDLVQERWNLVKKLFCVPAETHWAGFGCDTIAELGDEAAPCLSMARMAYKAGDLDAYNYACYMFARQFVHHYVNTNRWVRFNNEDTARFYRGHLRDDLHRELGLLQQRWEPERQYHHDSHLMPSLVQLRSLLLNEAPAQLAAVATPDQFSGPASGVIASCISVLRTSHPTRYERLIPGGEPSPFVAGLEREVSDPGSYLSQAIQTRPEADQLGTNQPIWPEVISWKSGRTPTGHRWTFGHVTPVPEGAPATMEAKPLNWNSRAFIYSFP